MNIKENGINIKGIATAYIVSGNYGGSLDKEVFSSVYHYSYYYTDNESSSKKRKHFNQIINDYLQSTLVNNSVNLSAYLDLVYRNDSIKLDEIHGKYQPVGAKGNSTVNLPMLLFIDDREKTVVQIPIDQIKLNNTQSTNVLMSFLKENAKHFESQIPDEFFNKYYQN